MANRITLIRELLKAGDKAKARKLISPLLDETPTVELWVLAAQAADSEKAAIYCLREALKIDPMDSAANRLLMKIEGSKPLTEKEKKKRSTQVVQPVSPQADPIKAATMRKRQTMQYERVAARRRVRGMIFWLLFIALFALIGLFAANVIGVFPGFIGFATRLLGGPAPVTEINGVPIKKLNYPISVVPISQSQRLSVSHFDLIDHGYVHEYTFPREFQELFAVNVNFLSPTPRNFAGNVGVYNNVGLDVTTTECGHATPGNSLIPAQAGVTLICTASRSGQWSVRILGMEGESVGAYAITLSQPFSAPTMPTVR